MIFLSKKRVHHVFSHTLKKGF